MALYANTCAIYEGRSKKMGTKRRLKILYWIRLQWIHEDIY